jgi:arylformamidase
VWPGDSQVRIERQASIAQGDAFNLSRLSLSCHTGTHVDAPFHFVQEGATVDSLPLDVLVGPAFVVEVGKLEGRGIQVDDLASLHLPQDITRLLIKTSNSDLWEDRPSEFESNYIHLEPETADWLVRQGIRLIGVDYLSVDAFRVNKHRVHETLLRAGVVVIEGLNLSRVPAGCCHLLCLPLKIEGGDGAPARVLVTRD